MKHLPFVWVASATAALLVVAVLLVPKKVNAQSQPEPPSEPLQSLSEDQQMQRETYFGKNATLTTPLTGSVVVGFASRGDYESGKHPTSPIVTLRPGASITHTLKVTSGSKVLIQGGRVGYREHNNYGGEVLVDHTASVVFSGGNAYSVVATGRSRVTITSGTIVSSLILGENATVNVKGGAVGEFIIGPGGVLNLFGTNLAKRLLRQNEPGYSRERAEQEDAYALSGTLSDGTSLRGKVLRVGKSSGSKVNFASALPTKTAAHP